MPHCMAQDCPSHSLFHLTYLSLATPIRGMYLGHTIPFKGWNHLIRYLANPLWSLETLAHVNAHYERACHYEVPTLLSKICKLFYLIILMIGCTRSLGGALDLMQDYRWFPFGFGFPIWDPNPRGLHWHMQGLHREPWASIAANNTPWTFMDAQRLLMIHFWDNGDMLGTLCLAGPHRSPTLLTGLPRLVQGHGNIHSTTWTLAEDLQASLIHMET